MLTLCSSDWKSVAREHELSVFLKYSCAHLFTYCFQLPLGFIGTAPNIYSLAL